MKKIKSKHVWLLVGIAILIYVLTTPLFLETTASALLLLDHRRAGKYLLRLCIILHPDNSACLGSTATVKFVEGMYDEALELSTKAIENNPDSCFYYMDRGDMFWHLAYVVAQEGDTQKVLDYMVKAHKDYCDAIEISPNRAELYEKRAQVYLDTAYYEDVLKDTEKALQIDSNRGNAHRLRALAYWNGFEDTSSACYHLRMAQDLYEKQKDTEGLETIKSYHDLILECDLVSED